MLALWGCNLSRAGHALPTASPSPVDSPNSWIAIAPGIEVREMDLPVASLLARGTMVVVRLDPAAVTLRVYYTPGEAQSLAEWQERLPDARIIVNGAFFDEANRALGLLVSDGQAFGQSFAGFGGMLQVDGAGMRVRSLVTEPYQGESLWQAVQAFPLLLEGGTLAAQGPGFDERSRRTWVGQDRSGRVLFGATHNLIGLADLQAWLLAADLDVMIAFALDGGRSTGMAIRTPGYQRILPSFDRLPSVIALYTP
ncbi:MAG: phosphodiester glycosidase family protein [Anaerolineae bacterium]